MSLEVGQLYVKLNLDTSAFSKQLDSIENKLRNIAKNQTKINLDVQVNSAALSSANKEIQSINSTAAQSAGIFSNLGGIIQNAFSFAIGSVLADGMREIQQAIGSIIPTAANFEHQMSAVKAVLTPTGDEFDALKQKAIDLGASTAYTATEVSYAMEQLAKQGVNAQGILGGATDATLALAAAAGTDLVTAATVSTDVMNAFSLDASQLTNAVNGITGAVNLSKFDIRDYQLALANGGAAVHAYGVSLEDFNAVIAATSSQFYSGRSAGTAFRHLITRLTPSTNTARDAMKELGLITADGTNVFYDSTGALKGMDEVAGIIQTTFGGLTEEQRAAYTEAIFGAEAIGAVIGLMDQGADGVRKFAEGIAEVNAAEQAATRLDNFEGAVEMVRGSLDSFVITVGDKVLPTLTDFVLSLVPIINTATDVANALFGSEEAFNRLPPVIQTAIVIVEEIADYFSSLADAAYSWGSNIADSFGSGLISAASSVVSALQEMGSWVEYWLAPGSPPRITPDLDKWGKEAAEVYFESFLKADLSSLKEFGDIVRSSLEQLVDKGSFKQEDVIPTVLGSREAFASAFHDIEITGEVSENTLQKIIKSAGAAGQEIEAVVRAYFKLHRASKLVREAQDRLSIAQEHINAAMRQFKEITSPIEDQLKDVRKQIEAIELAQEIKELEELANAIGGDGSEQAKARLRLQEIALEQELAAKEETFQGIMRNLEAEEEAAQRDLDNRQKEEDQAKIQFELEQQKLDTQKEYNDLVKEQIELLKKLAEEQTKANEQARKGGGGGGKGKDDTDAARLAQEKYNFSIADTEGKLAILRERLKGVKEGSKEYYDILGQIAPLEAKLADDKEKAAEKEKKEADARLKAERDYKFGIADTAGKLAILRDELSKTEEGSKEYYDILGDIAKLEEQQRKDAEKAAKGKGAGAGGIRKPEFAPEGQTETGVDQPQRSLRDIGKDEHERRLNEQENLRANREAAQQNANSITGIFTSLSATVNTIWSGMLSNLQTKLAPAITAIQSGVSAFWNVLVGFWNDHGSTIIAATNVLWEQIKTIIDTTLTIISTLTATVWNAIAQFINTHQETIKGVIFAAWLLIQGFISDTLSIIQSILNFWLAAVQGDWEGMWTAAKDLLVNIWDLIIGIIGNAGNVIAALFGTNLQALWELWQSNWNKINKFLTDLLLVIAAYIAIKLAEIRLAWHTFITNAQTLWNAFWEAVHIITLTLLAKVLQFVLDRFIELKTAWETFISNVKTAWETFWTNIKTFAETTFGQVKTNIDTKIGEIKSAWETFVSGIKSKWEELKELPEKLKGYLDEAKGKVTGIVEEFKSAAKSVGTGIIDGIKSGISSGIEGLRNAARDAARAAIDAAKGALKMSSPSKVFMDIGQNVTLGMSLGITDKLGDVASAMNRVTSATLSNSPAAQSMNTTGSRNITYQFNIDARGSTMNEKQFRDIIIDVTDNQAKKSVIRR